MFCRTYRLLLAGIISVATATHHASAQAVVRTLTTTASVPDIGRVVSVSTLVWSEEGQAVESRASGTVNTKHNGPYVLQVRLTTAQPDTILARLTDGAYGIVGTGEWIPIASGPGGANLANTVDYRVKRAIGSSQSLTLPVTYRVVAR
jgi:hypothetical protein